MTDKRSKNVRLSIADSTGQKLLRVARLFNQRAIAELQRRGHPLREAHTRLFPYLEPEGTRLTDLAARAGMTKQSAQKLVDEMVAEGYLKRASDPQDGRARLIMLTRKGIRGVGDGLDVLATVESDVATRVGSKRITELSRTLDAMLKVLDS